MIEIKARLEYIAHKHHKRQNKCPNQGFFFFYEHEYKPNHKERKHNIPRKGVEIKVIECFAEVVGNFKKSRFDRFSRVIPGSKFF